MSSAQTQAATFTAAGQAEAERELAVLKAEVDRYQKRRDAIVGQLGALRDVITGFGDEPSAAPRMSLLTTTRAGRVTRQAQ